jgi:drug/metabolite transporter (DMT)-like permease
MNASGYFYLGANLILSLASTLAMKWRASSYVSVAAEKGRFAYLISMVLDPWVLLALAASVLAMLAWMSALERTALSQAFAFTALIYVLVPASAWFLFNERISLVQAVGILLIVCGVVLAEVGRSI